jgi:uncharacterized delta-60 repeat protein
VKHHRQHRVLLQKCIEVLESRRMLSAGALDPSFNGDGEATANFGGEVTVNANDLAVQTDGKTVVVGGSSALDFAVARFNIDGTPDTTFGSNHIGTVLTPGSGPSEATAVAIQTDGKIVVAGITGSSDDLGSSDGLGSGDDFEVMRYNANGTLDTSFDHDGKVTFNFGNFVDNGYSVGAIAIQADGKIVVGGGAIRGSGLALYTDEFAVARLNTNGSLDSSFDGDGKKTISFGNEDTLSSLLIRGTTILAVGTSAGGSPSSKVAIAAITHAGGMDNTFNGDGKFTAVLPGESYSTARAALVQPDGKIVIVGAGGVDENSPLNLEMARFNANGGEDTTFGAAHNGWVKTNLGGSYETGFGVITSVDGGLIVGATSGGFDQFLGYSANGVPDATFGTNGKVIEKFGGGGGLVAGPGRRFVTAGGSEFHTARLLEANANLVSVASLNPTASEAGPTPATFFVYRSERLPTPLSVYLSISGTATSQLTRVPFAKADYTGVTAPPPPGIGGAGGNTVPAGPNIAWVVIPANQTFAEVTITPIDDAIPEKTETAIFTILNNPAYDLGTPTSTTLFILDNDSTSTTLNATADSYVQDGSAAGTNFGWATNLVVKDGPTGFNRYSYVKFDLSNVSTISSVQLQLYGNLSSAQNASVATDVYSVADTSWTESGITFNNAPPAGPNPLAATTITGTGGAEYTWDVTAYVKAQKAAGHNIVSFVLKDPLASDSAVILNSREAAMGPSLKIS